VEQKKKKGLTPKQKQALELLTCGKGLSYKEIAETVGVNPKTLWDWRNDPEYTHFQEALQKLNDERWLATVDAARAAAMRLVNNDNQKMVEFVLRTGGINPATKVEADVDVSAQVVFIDDMKVEADEDTT
jgi:transposase-like protein